MTNDEATFRSSFASTQAVAAGMGVGLSILFLAATGCAFSVETLSLPVFVLAGAVCAFVCARLLGKVSPHERLGELRAHFFGLYVHAGALFLIVFVPLLLVAAHHLFEVMRNRELWRVVRFCGELPELVLLVALVVSMPAWAVVAACAMLLWRSWFRFGASGFARERPDA